MGGSSSPILDNRPINCKDNEAGHSGTVDSRQSSNASSPPSSHSGALSAHCAEPEPSRDSSGFALLSDEQHQTNQVSLDITAEHLIFQQIFTRKCRLPLVEILDFAGPVFDTVLQMWLKTCMVLDDGSFLDTVKEDISLGLGYRDPSTLREVRKALRPITVAAGKIYISICRCRNHGNPNLPQPSYRDNVLVSHYDDCHEVASLSGFWLEGYKFVTASHFLNVDVPLGPERKQDTIEFLKYVLPASQIDSRTLMRARVSCQLKSYDAGAYDDDDEDLEDHDAPSIYNVQLVDFDEAGGIAVFKLASDETRRPRTWINNNQLSSAGADIPHRITQNVFSTYYPGHDKDIRLIKDPMRVQKAVQWNCYSNYELLAKERVHECRKHYNDVYKDKQVPCFTEIFTPDERSIAFGNMATIDRWTAPPGPHASTILRTHTIPGFQGSSGGMVGCTEVSDYHLSGDKMVPDVSVKIMGVLIGEPGAYNAFAAFTQKGIDEIVNL